jgi:hypothetical protein
MLQIIRYYKFSKKLSNFNASNPTWNMSVSPETRENSRTPPRSGSPAFAESKELALGYAECHTNDRILPTCVHLQFNFFMYTKQNVRLSQLLVRHLSTILTGLDVWAEQKKTQQQKVIAEVLLEKSVSV